MNPDEKKVIIPQRVAEINAEIARQGNKDFSVAPSSPSYIPNNTTITSASLQGATPLSIPTMNTPTTSAGVNADIVSQGKNAAQLAQDQYQNELKVYETQAQAKTTEQEGKVRGIFNNILGIKGEKVQAEEKAGIPKLNTEIAEINNRIAGAEGARVAELAALNTSNMTAAGSLAAQAGINRKYAMQQLTEGIMLNAKTNNLTALQGNIDRKIALELEPLEMQYKFESDFLTDNRANLTKAEERTFQAKADATKRLLDESSQTLQSIGDFAKTVAANGADAGTIAKVSSAKTMAEAVQAAGQYAGDITERLYKKEQLNNARLQGEKLRQEIEQGQPLTGEFAGIINSAAGLVANTKKATVKQNIANYISTQNYPSAYAEIANAVSDGLTGTAKTTFDDARTDIGVMTGMRKAIEDYTNAGGNVGFLKGTADNIAKKFGQLATDPKFSALGTQLQREFQMYRLNMTGAAFSPEESREYASVNPRTNATLDLNLATVDGALAQLTNRITSTINPRVPGAEKIYNLAFAKADTTENQTPVGDVQNVGGVKYIKAQDGLYYPENQAPQSTTQTTTPTSLSDYKNPFSSFGSLFNFK